MIERFLDLKRFIFQKGPTDLLLTIEGKILLLEYFVLCDLFNPTIEDFSI